MLDLVIFGRQHAGGYPPCLSGALGGANIASMQEEGSAYTISDERAPLESDARDCDRRGVRVHYMWELAHMGAY